MKWIGHICFALSGALMSFNALAASPANPLVSDQWRARPLVLVTPSAGNQGYQRMRRLISNQQTAFDERDMVLYTIENGIGQRNGAGMTTAETEAILEDLDVKPDGALTVILIGKDGGKKVQQTGFVNPDELFTTIDRMPMRRQERTSDDRASKPE
ncbi:DUF4174 domain-containing protein [Larsenimonas salina]|uniref:DUF4174 domain-containing protein n=1 Tax=Larsenimonas salina TaxID=1295565 RepID=UPI002072BE7A|nr:DUF4174 domain-containing protein [Larsenimonas salina]MCM5705174.1 DUF4174 domain-containing protein [Larsenimonas salina]